MYARGCDYTHFHREEKTVGRPVTAHRKTVYCFRSSCVRDDIRIWYDLSISPNLDIYLGTLGVAYFRQVLRNGCVRSDVPFGKVDFLCTLCTVHESKKINLFFFLNVTLELQLYYKRNTRYWILSILCSYNVFVVRFILTWATRIVIVRSVILYCSSWDYIVVRLGTQVIYVWRAVCAKRSVRERFFFSEKRSTPLYCYCRRRFG